MQEARTKPVRKYQCDCARWLMAVGNSGGCHDGRQAQLRLPWQLSEIFQVTRKRNPPDDRMSFDKMKGEL